MFPDAARPNAAHVDDPGTFQYVNATSGQGVHRTGLCTSSPAAVRPIAHAGVTELVINDGHMTRFVTRNRVDSRSSVSFMLSSRIAALLVEARVYADRPPCKR